MLGDIRRLQGKDEQAIKAYNDYLLIIPHDLRYIHRRALLNERLGNFELALDDANRLVDRETDPKNYQKFREYERELRYKWMAELKENSP